MHNLGSFDGYFIYKALSKYANVKGYEVNTIMDQKHRFITITLTTKTGRVITFKDSYRIFSVSLNELAKVFGIPGKLHPYDKTFNELGILNNFKLLRRFKLYAMQDSVTLYEALKQAQQLYCDMYNVDICSIVSTSTLSLKIFRQDYMKHGIPILKPSEDDFIRKGYFGGATDYYKLHCKNVHYYDVNSLYPYAMLKPMPHQLVQKHEDLSNFQLENFFGFALAKVTCPQNMLRPVLPYSSNDRTFYPTAGTATWTGVYFSEELKAVKDIGYNIELIKGYEFSKEYIFKEYVDHFYNKKKVSTGPQRFIANGTAAP